MRKSQKRGEKSQSQQQPETLKGWKQISEFLGEPVSVVKRWAAEGMPIHREGQFVATSSSELNSWLGQESGKPVHVATENTDLTAELKRGLSFIRHEKSERPKKKQSVLSRKAKS
jgi:phage terminase Nu1 subunit (DNA packaging protein)